MFGVSLEDVYEFDDDINDVGNDLENDVDNYIYDDIVDYTYRFESR